MKKLIIIIILNSFLLSKTIAQESTHCIEIKEGYIVKLIEKDNENIGLSKSIDFLFFESLPNIIDKSTPITLLNDGGTLIKIKYYRSVNFERFMLRDFNEFDYGEYPKFDSIDVKGFNIDIYRVVLAGYNEFNLGKDFVETSDETSHIYSYFFNLTEKEQMENYDVIYPELIIAW